MNFVAIDVETANADMSTICQVGLAKYVDGSLVDEWVTLVNPEDFFDPVNVEIHGINEDDVRHATTFPAISKELITRIDGAVCVCHTHFDRVSLLQAFDRYQLFQPHLTWLDSARVARRAWAEFAWKGYGLANICATLGYEFKHHDAGEDAKAAGHVLLAASEKAGLDIDGWLRRVGQPIDGAHSSVAREGNPEGEMYGEVVVFTGALSVPRKQAAEMAASIGCRVGTSVTNKTTLLVVGDQDVTRLAGNTKSSKHRKAETLISKGGGLRIIRETDFMQLVSHA